MTLDPGPVPPAAPPRPPITTRIRPFLPGLALTAAVTLIVLWTARLTPTISPMVVSLVVGAAAGSILGGLGRARPATRRHVARIRPGTAWTARHVLRAGVVLLGVQVSIPEVLDLGWRGLAVVAVTMVATLAGTLALGRWLRLPRVTSLLVATGYAVCGAAAVSAMRGALGGDDERDDEAAASALALVTLFGSLAIPALPWLAGLLGLGDHDTGLWIGASVQEVAQVVTAAGSVSDPALATATVAKLTRVVLLAPLVAVVGVLVARRTRRVGLPDRDATAGGGGPFAPAPSRGGTRGAPPVPLFVVGFCLAVAARSLGLLPPEWVDALARTSQIAFVAAMFAMGLGIDVGHLVRTGRRALLLGALSAVLVTGVALVGVLV